jgi:hypothetical protein
MPDPRCDLECYIVTYCLEDIAQRAIDAFRSSGGERTKLTIMDNSPTPLVLRGYEAKYNFPFNPSLSRVWNWSLALCRTRWVMVLNGDAVCEPGWAEVFSRDEHMTPVKLHSRFSHFLLDRSLIRKVGWFDERLTTLYWEDTDFVRRASLKGEPWCADCPLNQFLHNVYPEPKPHPVFKRYMNEVAEALGAPHFKNNEVRYHDKWGDNNNQPLAGGEPRWEEINWYPCVELPT